MEEMALGLRIFGILGVIIGLAVLAMTAAGQINHAEPSRGYMVGGILVVFGILRTARSFGMR